MFDMIAFDADDTLWENETLYHAVRDRFEALMAPYQPADVVDDVLYRVESSNLAVFGYGIKGFVLSMIETAIELSDGQIPAKDIQAIIGFGKEMAAAPVQPLKHVEETLIALAADYTLLLITKGDLMDQENKVMRSRLGAYFSAVEIVSDKTTDVYRAILAKHDLAPERFLMVGNSLRSDILPVLAVGGHAVYIPNDLTWAHENTVDPAHAGLEGYHALDHIGQLPGLLRELNGA